MLVTEQEATKKWCPFSFKSLSDPDRCEASGCMSWREKGSKRVAVPEYPCSDGIEGCEACTPGYSGKHIHMYVPTGYCGLAGKPEVA